jgi:hypothetical protein
LPLGRWISSIDAGIVALSTAALAFAAILFLPAMLHGGDIYWHIAAGRWMLENAAVLRIDPFSLTHAGHSWQTFGWIGDTLMALAYIGAGWSGILILFGAAAAAGAGVLAWQLSRSLQGFALLGMIALAFVCAASALLARPAVLAWPLFVIWLAGLLAARAKGRAPSLKLVLVMILWANLHTSFAVGLILILPFGIEAVWEDRRALRGWGVFAGVCLIGALITPYGIDTVNQAFRMLAVPQPMSGMGLAALALAAIALLAFTSGRAGIKPFRIAVLVWLAYLGLSRAADLMLFAAGAPFLVAEPLGQAWRMQGQPQRLRWVGALALAAVMAATAVFRIAIPAVRADDESTPGAALASIPAALVRGPVLNEERFGAYLIFNDVRPFIDGRVGLYGENFHRRYLKMMQPDEPLLETTLVKYRIRWTILAADNPAVRAMDNMKRWHRHYADAHAVVHVRNDGP